MVYLEEILLWSTEHVMHSTETTFNHQETVLYKTNKQIQEKRNLINFICK